MSSVPVSELTDAAVRTFRLSRWDYQLLKTNDAPTADYAKANVAHRQLTNANKAETQNSWCRSACCSPSCWSCAPRRARQ